MVTVLLVMKTQPGANQVQTLTLDSTLVIRETSSMHLPCILSRCDADEGFTNVGGGRDYTSILLALRTVVM